EDCGLLSPETVRRILCDASVIPIVLGGESLPLDVGRSTRAIPPHIRTALNLRDQGCVIPGCQTPPRYCDAHHAIHWLHGGPTRLENLCLLCARHHTMVHDGTITLPDWVLEMAGRLPARE
ncbi:MAG TPA: HNH endonuclease, partial [Acidimicrobiia bacterium]|nr:HNH endonuclease [Acidimicrobiia bacterium]